MSKYDKVDRRTMLRIGLGALFGYAVGTGFGFLTRTEKDAGLNSGSENSSNKAVISPGDGAGEKLYIPANNKEKLDLNSNYDTNGYTYEQIAFDPQEPCGYDDYPACQLLVDKPGWVKNWHQDGDWPAGEIPDINGFYFDKEEGKYFKIPPTEVPTNKL